ncbi:MULTISPECIES: DUF2062 domain-containing protein [unclassified Polaromonas]|uniref:DUF2062 domain-containing protein n=1 Tax=unclassified Polaromonas TaxID=2638319 RepID=UPI0018C9318E|nr:MULTISPECIES: DUF2062 domain-containing protein [unclassified Polaromonas]MBG6072355.1 uncharacterized protein (DUF2062 family) [Polaromonas sp. CG_9.7]MBG6114214.1 uncharacterized protein (DUF2062 family) [Polaromonas sp. CG_9.2]MDH6182828.1 uncharacterized protein (DUF2062 family) [Polaromonas sp. CG_23.6]
MNADQPLTSARSSNGRLAGLINRLRSALPCRESLAAHPWLKPVAHRLLDRQLWRAQHEAVARGVAIGIFWAFAVPVAQFALATLNCVWWRANIPVAAGMTLVTNPFTIGFWLWLAYRLGSLVLDAPAPVPLADGAGMLAWLGSFGAPTILGMGIFAFGGALTGYLVAKLAWRMRVGFKRWRRQNTPRTAATPPAG